MEKIKIQTTQNVEIEYELAGIGDRFIAGLIDLFLQIGCLIFIALTGAFLEIENDGFYLVWLLFLIPFFGYDFLCEMFMNGQSVGKKYMYIRVIKLDGGQPTLGSYLLRWVFRPIDVTLFAGAVAMATILLNGKGQRLGDIAANTTVIRLKSAVKLEDTILSDLEKNYQPTYPQVIDLREADIAVIKEALNVTLNPPDIPAERSLRELAKQHIEARLGIQSALQPANFLAVIIKDYNFYKGVWES